MVEHWRILEVLAPARRDKHESKAKVALEALKVDKSMAELAQLFSEHSEQTSAWRKQLLESAGSVSEGKRVAKSDVVDIDELSKKIGRLETERDFLATRLKPWKAERLAKDWGPLH
jgi:transposase-like protein